MDGGDGEVGREEGGRLMGERGRGEGRGATEGKKETGRVSNGRIRIKRKIKVNAFRRPLCRRLVGMNGAR